MDESRSPGGERLQKVLAALGLGSRRGIETWIEAGRVTVNGMPAALGARVQPEDRIAIDGRPVDRSVSPLDHERVVLGYHKPLGEVTTRRDPQGRPTVFEHLPTPPAGRWVAVGRLDVNTTGLLLFTNDGALAHRLMHPSSEVEREYLVRLRGHPTGEVLDRLRSGLALEDGWARFDEIAPHGASDGHAWYRVILREGRNREVRRLWSAVGHEVSRLTRLRYGPVRLPEDLRPGQARRLPEALVAELARAAESAGTGSQTRSSTGEA